MNIDINMNDPKMNSIILLRINIKNNLRDYYIKHK